eukprot:TRINITY_DN42986_c0_g1_i1.p1 TRINITY_DN42986_c0_g1~~TRINITY_DN42986_c0_g1_i1.p1  ORF type:complete len:162 (+),score=18.05 TRINITY_DN42986_c0_g1_i1:209-694(+)
MDPGHQFKPFSRRIDSKRLESGTRQARWLLAHFGRTDRSLYRPDGSYSYITMYNNYVTEVAGRREASLSSPLSELLGIRTLRYLVAQAKNLPPQPQLYDIHAKGEDEDESEIAGTNQAAVSSALVDPNRIAMLARDILPSLKIGRAVQQECRDRSRMPSSA